MARFGFCSGTYQSQSPNVDAERCINLIPENVESQHGKSAMALYGVPGKSIFAQAQDTSFRGGIFVTSPSPGRLFCVIGSGFYEFDSKGNVIAKRGTVANDGLPASLAQGQTFLCVAAGGSAYFFNLGTNTFGQIDTTSGAAIQAAVSQVDFSDAYFIALLHSQNVFNGTFQLSNLGDPTTWNPLNIFQVEVYPDAPIAIKVDHRELWVAGPKAIQPYYDSGNFFTPFQPSSGAFIEHGIAAPFTFAKQDNTLFWLGVSERGGITAWRSQGYLPVRISNHAVETFWSSYPTVSDATGYAYTQNGHPFYVLTFPTADATWVYDVSTQMWHERAQWSSGAFHADRAQFHVYAFGKHIVGSLSSGTLYYLDATNFADADLPLRWMRRAPHIATEKQRTYLSELVVDMETGTSTLPLYDTKGNQRAPQCQLRVSRDGGHTFSGGKWRSMGKIGQYKNLVRWKRLGQARDFVFEVSGADPAPIRIVDAYIPPPVERLATRIRQMA